MADNTQNLSHHESHQHFNLQDDLNSRLRRQDMRDQISEYQTGRAHNPIYKHIADLHEPIEWLQRNDDPQNIAIRNLLEETESLFSEDIRAATMPPRLKLPKLKYYGTRDQTEHLETYKSWIELNSASNAFQC